MGYIGQTITTVFPTSISVDSATISGNASVGGTLGVTGVSTLSDNIVFDASSKGVHLGVTSATASNLQDDYEEGTFSPVFHTGGGVNGLTHDYSLGTYTKIGNRVFLNGFASLSGKDGASIIGGNVTIAGLPFTIANNNNAYSAAGLRIQNISFADQCSLATVVNSTTLDFREITNSGSVTTLTDGNIASNSYVIFDIAYVVD